MKKVMLFLFITGALCLISGCWNLVEVNDTSVCRAIGADLAPGNMLKASYQLEQPAASKESGASSQAKTLTVVSSGDTPSYAARRLFLGFPHLPLWSQAEVYIVGEELARHDMSLLADHWGRNRNVRKTILVAVARGCKAVDVLNIPETFSGTAVKNLDLLMTLQEAQYGAYLKTTMSELIVKFYTPGIDPAVPEIRLVKDSQGQKRIKLCGMAVFKGQKMVGSLNETESRG